ncbi:MAG: tetratricopeptide repeat protein, partial [Rhodospirillales bacterium]|nr:tetratricopeptide repeat protein [Rhodospirillales bacterium]
MDGLHPNPAAESELEQAFAHHRAGRLEMAVGLYRRVLEQDLGNIQVLKPLGDALHDQGEHEAALLAYGAALEAEPGNLAAQLNLANTLIGVERYDEAQARSRRTLKLHPDCTPALANLGQALLKAGRPVGAVEAYEKRARLVPGDGKALNDLGVARQWTGDIEGAIRAFGQALEVDAGAILAERNLQIALLDCPGLSSEELFARHRELGRRHGRNLSRQRSFTPARERRLRVGYVSSDFHDHPVGRNILPLLAHHDRDAFEVFLYGENDPDDSMNPRFRSLADHWRDSTGMADEALAGLIEGDGIDVLVLLAGRFNANRPLVATYRPAPVQVSFHDCATSGLDEMDYWLTDHDLHPKDTPERFTEKLYRLDQFYQFEPPVDFPVPGPPPSVQNGFVSFGCFNKPEKINDRVI